MKPDAPYRRVRIHHWVAFLLWMIWAQLGWSHTQFNASCLNLKEGGNNTVLYLRLEPTLFHIDAQSGNLTADMQLRISFRKQPEGRMVVVRQKQLQFRHDFLSGADPFFYTFAFDVAPGNYDIIVEVEDRSTRRTYLETIPHQCRDLSAAVALSDPQLIQEFGDILAPQPLLGEHFTAVPEHLNMSVLVYTQQPGYYRAKAVLYLRQAASRAGPIDVELSQCSQFVTLNQANAIVDARSGLATLNHRLDIAELPHGEYLVEVYLYRDDSLVAESARSFAIDWKRLKDVFGDLNAAIDMMALVTSAEQIMALKAIQNADEQQAAFLDFWQRRANPSQETAVDAIERYYERIFYAIENFNEGMPGWQTDRGQTLTLYGPPDHQSSMKFNGRLFEAWTYSRWGMKFLFRNDEGKMRRVALG
jgi:GWxTD domain-containing protein